MKFALCLAAVLAAVALPQAAVAEKLYFPVMNIGPACAPTCSNLTLDFNYRCVQCLYTSGWFPVWSNTSQPMYSMSRVPLYEAGLKYVCALPFTWFAPYTQVITSTHLFNSRQMYPLLPKNVTVCGIKGADGKESCVTRNMGPDRVRRNDNNTGYCYEGIGWLKLDPPCNGVPDPLNNISFNTPEQLAMAGFPAARRFEEYIPTATKFARDLMTDVQIAQDSLYICNQIPWSDTLYFMALEESDQDELEKWFGDDWTDELQGKLEKGELFKMDMATWMENLTIDIGTRMQPGAYAVLEKARTKDGKFVLRTILLAISDPGTHGARNKHQVYSPQKSPTAFILAMIYARCSLIFHQIRIGHFYHYHMMISAMHYALFNTIQPGVLLGKANHPVRMLLDEWSDPIIQQAIQVGTYLGTTTPPYVAIKPPAYPQMHNFYAEKGPLGEPMDMYGTHPARMMEVSKLKAADFTSPGGQAWDLYEHAKFSTELIKLIYDYHLEAIKVYYPGNKAVKEDKAVQRFAAFLKDPKGSNLGRINKNNRITTREELAEVTSNMMYRAAIHACLHLQDFFKNNVNIVANPTRIDFPILPDPTKTFNISDMMALMPNAQSTAEQMFQGYNIIMVSPQGGAWIQKKADGTPDWTALLPFFPNQGKGAKANKASVEFRKKFVDWIYAWKTTGFIRQTDTNWNLPYELTTKIDF